MQYTSERYKPQGGQKHFSSFPLSCNSLITPEKRYFGTKRLVIVKKSSPKNLSADCRSTDCRQVTKSFQKFRARFERKLYLNPPIVASTQPTVPSPPQQRTRKSGTLWKNFRLKQKTILSQRAE